MGRGTWTLSTAGDTADAPSRGWAGWAHPMIALFLLLALTVPDATAATAGQDPTLLSVATAHFTIEAAPELAEALDTCAQMVEPVYLALSAALDSSLPPGVVIRLWTQEDDRPGIDPTSQKVDGVIVPRLQVRRVLDLRIPADESGPAWAAALDEGLRLLLASQLLAAASDGRMPSGLQLGAARYLQEPGETATILVARLREASPASAPSWSELNRPGAEYEDPLLHQAWSLSMVHFLLQRRGFGSFNRLTAALRRADGWRSALSETYGEDGTQLEAAWRTGLTAYANGGWQEHLLYRIDLSRVEQHLKAGDFRGAASQVRGALAFLDTRSTQDAAAARALLELAEEALRARGDLDLGRSLLNSGDYRQALAAAEAAAPPLQSVGDQAGADQARDMAERARLGMAAAAGIARARSLPSWQSVRAVLLARHAARQLARLGDEVGAQNLERWSHARAFPAGVLGAIMAMAGAMLIGANVVTRRRSMDPPA